jgi:SSS family solute:Na+ symporter
MQLSLSEIIVPLLYLVLLLVLGFRSSTSVDRTGFIAGGRILTLPAFIATLVTTWYGGILGVGEFTFNYGLSNWIVFGLPYYIFAVLYALFLAPAIRKSPALTIPGQVALCYGEKAGALSAIWAFFMTSPAPYIVMLGLLLTWMTGWPLWICIVLGAVFSMFYVFKGGFQAVVRTDKLQFLLMFLGFILVFTVLVTKYGGYAFLKFNLPPVHLSLTGGNTWSYILVWYFIAVWTFVDPGFHQRCAAASSPRVARNGILFAIIFWLAFDFLTTSVGLYARAILPSLKNPTLSFPILAHQVLSPFVSGLFLTGLLATVMSTIDSYTLLSAISFGDDFLGRLSGKNRDSVRRIRLGVLFTAIFAVVLAIWLPSVVQLWYVIGTLFIPPMLLPVLSSYFPAIKVPSSYAIANLVIGFLCPLGWLIAGVVAGNGSMNPDYPLGVQPMFPGVLVSLVLFLLGRRSFKKNVESGK